ncbi:MAG: O-antigen ligase family protein [Rhodospirillales bacterium]|nr:O-antigen ligase family protein [Rhodospirillales bacterium]
MSRFLFSLRLSAGTVLALAAVLTPSLAVLAPRGLAPLFVIAAIVVLVLHAVRKRSFPALEPKSPLLLAGVVIWGAISVLWSIVPEASLRMSVSLFGIFLAGLVLLAAVRSFSGADRNYFNISLLAGALIGLGVLGFEVFSDAALLRLLKWGPGLTAEQIRVDLGINYFTYLKNGISVIALLIWPVALLLWRRDRRLAAAVIFIAAAAAYFGESKASVAALATGAIFAGIGAILPKKGGVLLGFLIAAGVLLAPVPFYLAGDPQDSVELREKAPAAAYNRLKIWHFTAQKIAQRPILGWGLDSSRVIPGGQEEIKVYYDSRDSAGNRQFEFQERMPLHPHNAFLQVWLELGLIGAILCGLIPVSISLAICRILPDGPNRAAAFGALGTALTLAGLSYGLWQSWWLAALWLAALFMIASQGLRKNGEPG